MSRAACKVIIDGGILRSAGLEIASLAENQGAAFSEHFESLNEQGKARVIALSQKCCDWAEKIRKWTEEMREVAQDVTGVGGGYGGG